MACQLCGCRYPAMENRPLPARLLVDSINAADGAFMRPGTAMHTPRSNTSVPCPDLPGQDGRLRCLLSFHTNIPDIPRHKPSQSESFGSRDVGSASCEQNQEAGSRRRQAVLQEAADATQRA